MDHPSYWFISSAHIMTVVTAKVAYSWSQQLLWAPEVGTVASQFLSFPIAAICFAHQSHTASLSWKLSSL